MLRKHVLVASLTAVLSCLPALASAETNPFLPAPATPQAAGTTSSTGGPLVQNQGGMPALPMPPAVGLQPALPGLLAPIPQPAADEQPIGMVNGELIYKDGTRYKFKAEKKDSDKKGGPAVKRKKLVKPVKPAAKQGAAGKGVARASASKQPNVIKVLPNAAPVKTVSPGERSAAIPPMPGKPAVLANKATPGSKTQGAKQSAVPIKVITEKK